MTRWTTHLLPVLILGSWNATAIATLDSPLAALTSVEAPVRERALLQLGDVEPLDAAAIVAVADALNDPVASVRWHSVAALRKIGPPAASELLRRIDDERPSAHLGTLRHCGNSEIPFVPVRGELAAGALAAMDGLDAATMWRRFLSATGNVKDRLRGVLSVSRVIPPPEILSTLHDVPESDRRFALGVVKEICDAMRTLLAYRYATRNGERVAAPAGFEEDITELRSDRRHRRGAFGWFESHMFSERDDTAALMDAAERALPARDSLARSLAKTVRSARRQPERSTAAFEGDVAEVLSMMGGSGRRQWRRLVKGSPYPEKWFASVAFDDGDLESHASAFRNAVLSGQPAALLQVAASLRYWKTNGGRPLDQRQWRGLTAAIGEPAARAFLSQPVPAESWTHEILAIGAARFAQSRHRALLMPLWIQLARCGSPHEELNNILWPGASKGERSEVWKSALADAEDPAHPPGHRLTRWLQELPAPPRSEGRALATRIVSAVLGNRLVLDDDLDESRIDGLASHWRSALQAAALAAPCEGHEAPCARLLRNVRAPRTAQVRALKAVVDAPSADFDDIVDALTRLGSASDTRPFAVEQLKAKLLITTDRARALQLAEALLQATSGDAAHETVWQVMQETPPAALATRSAIAEALFRTLSLWEVDATKWVSHAAEALGTTDGSADSFLLDFLAEAADDSAARRGTERSGGHQSLVTALGRVLAQPGQHTRALVRIWRGFDLPLNARITALPQAACRGCGEHVTLVDVQQVAATAAQGPERARLIKRLFMAEDPRVACKVVDALPDFGAEADPVAARLLRSLVTRRRGRYFRGALDRAGDMSCSSDRRVWTSVQGDTAEWIFLQRLNGLPVDQTRQIIRLAIRGDRKHGEGAGRTADYLVGHPATLPSATQSEMLGASEAPTFQYGSPSLPAVTASSLIEWLDHDNAINRTWVQFARRLWLPTEIQDPVRNFPPVSRIQPPSGANIEQLRLVWVRLASRWDAIPPIHRTLLLPLLEHAGADPAAVQAILSTSLQSPEAGERRGAIQIATRLAANVNGLASAVAAESAAQGAAANLGPSVDSLFSFLRGPTRCEQSAGGNEQPKFPWPPPLGYRTPEQLQLTWFGRRRQRAGEWISRIRDLLADVDPNYEIGVFTGPPGGFALVSRVERIDESGSPFPGRARWTSTGLAKFDLSGLLGDLFLEKPGLFRVVVFVVTDLDTFDPATDPAGASLETVVGHHGALHLPPELDRMPLHRKNLFALVYCFERAPGQGIQPWVDGGPSSRRHLELIGLWGRIRRT